MSIRRCRFCSFWGGYADSRCANPVAASIVMLCTGDGSCIAFRSAALLPESYVDQANITESEEAQRLCEVGA